MAVLKRGAALHAPDGTTIGEGRAYVYLRQPEEQAQDAQGTLSLDWWDDAARPAAIAIADGPTLEIEVASDRLSGCMVGRILRYRVRWPGAGAHQKLLLPGVVAPDPIEQGL